MIAIPFSESPADGANRGLDEDFNVSTVGRRHRLRAMRNSGRGLPGATLRQIQGAIGKDHK